MINDETVAGGRWSGNCGVPKSCEELASALQESVMICIGMMHVC
jgi:hypothetical protein